MPFSIILLFFIANNVFLLSRIAQSSSHNWPSDINDELVSLGNIIAVFAAFDKSDDSGNCPRLVDEMSSLLGKSTDGPIQFFILFNTVLSWSRQ